MTERQATALILAVGYGLLTAGACLLVGPWSLVASGLALLALGLTRVLMEGRP